jgi:hypothetical protein
MSITTDPDFTQLPRTVLLGSKRPRVPVSLFTWLILSGVHTERGTLHSVSLESYAQHPRSVTTSLYAPRARRYIGYRHHVWPVDGWMVMVVGHHELPCGNMLVEPFNEWLAQLDPVIILDYRDAAISEGWRPSYYGCNGEPVPQPVPRGLAHWWPDREIDVDASPLNPNFAFS